MLNETVTLCISAFSYRWLAETCFVQKQRATGVGCNRGYVSGLGCQCFERKGFNTVMHQNESKAKQEVAGDYVMSCYVISHS